MKNTSFLIGTLVAAATLGLSTTAFAGGPEPVPVDNGKGFITGIQVGYVDTHWGDIHESAFDNLDLKVSDDTGVGVRPYIGFSLNKFFSFELGWTYLGHAKIASYAGGQVNDIPLTTIKNYAFDNSLRFNTPFTDNFGIFARIGVAYLISKDALRWRVYVFPVSRTVPPIRRSSSNFAVTYGAGVYYNLSSKLRFELAWTHFRGDSEAHDNYQPSPDFFSLGISYRWTKLFR